ncbi:MAG: dihydrofolate reductase family protein [Gemmatimonadota bacterium]|nr:dihydrofolate reductase family protein [Gemmatimonadota bacterium]
MREVIYSVAASLDGYIADPDGAYDWIPHEEAIDWDGFLARFDTVVMGRGTWEVLAREGRGPTAGKRTIVVSTTLEDVGDDEVTLVGEDAAGAVRELREEDGEAIWLMGGGKLFGSLLDEGLVDGVEVAVVPVLLGGGIPLLPEGHDRTRLELVDSTIYPSGIAMLRYAVDGG